VTRERGVSGQRGRPEQPSVCWSGGVSGGKGVRLSLGWLGPGVPGSRARLIAVGRAAAGLAGLVEAVEFVESEVELDLGGLPGPVGQAPAGDQPPAGLVVIMHRDPCHS
jgi:hypothetical protein